MRYFVFPPFAILCALLLFSSVLFSSTVRASEVTPVTLDVEGYASIEGGKKSVARDGALNDAFKRAIEQVVGVMVEAKTAIRDAVLLQDKIYSKSSGFIKSYKINTETFESDACRVSIKATVSRARLEKGLDEVGLLSKKMGKPRVAVIMTEQNIGNDTPSGSLGDGAIDAGIAYTILIKFFEKKGYTLVDRETLVALAKREGALSATGAISSTDAAIQVAAGGGAEVVIIGQAVAKAGGSALSDSKMRTSLATVSARVVDADTGELITSYSVTSRPVVNINPTAGGAAAIETASREMAEKLNKQIIAKWKQKVSGTRLVKLTIKNIEFSDTNKVKEFIRERLMHVEETNDRGYRDGTLSLDVESSGTAKELAEEISNTHMDGFGFKVVSYTVNTLNVHLQKK